ncbi:PQQ-dependent sugar dehydrogenase [Paracoccus sp. (in: a-proteobacteria)]|uniref:PQQ-dependent sugar dehydrogenase n=1 Tax=Paracoccus sp. TaxID=267 RepID=UPI002897FE3A|nr:PQQ-dependent sugar dehydrogenase [Paracoccus sp. (in: a-proteobacteria)]
MTRAALFLLAACLASTPALADFNAEPPHVPSQKPAFAGQTRAPVLAPQFALQAEVVADGLDFPWAVTRLPDGYFLVTERPGKMRLIGPDGHIGAPIAGLPKVDDRQQGGLLDVAIAPDFAQTRQIWWSYSEPRFRKRNNTAVATARLSQDGTKLEDVRVIFQQSPKWASTMHFGSRLVFDRDGMLFVTLGERSYEEPRQLAQDLTTHLGKVVRIDPMTGKPANPQGNFPPAAKAQPEIWSYGHRNIQAAALDPASGKLWTAEHGPQGGDELNQPEAGKNYGWPIITYGEDYDGSPMGEGLTAKEGMEQPVYYWDPVIAPSGMAFYQGAMFPEMQGDILLGGLRSMALVRLKMADGKVIGEERFLEGENRIRDVEIGPSGEIYVLTDDAEGQLLRLTRKP